MGRGPSEREGQNLISLEVVGYVVVNEFTFQGVKVEQIESVPGSDY